MSTGASNRGNSGEVSIRTGDANAAASSSGPHKSGSGGNITLAVGTAQFGVGGAIRLSAGSTSGMYPYNARNPIDVTGGEIEITSGSSKQTHSGHIKMSTASAGMKGESGYLKLQTGDASFGDAGHIGKLSDVLLGTKDMLIFDFDDLHPHPCYFVQIRSNDWRF